MTEQASALRHNENKVDETHAAHHIVSVGTYMTAFLVLLVLTVLTVVVAYFNFGGLWNLVIALGIATIKATVVTLWFMHVRYSGRLIQLSIATSLLFFALLIFGTLMDVWTRHNVTPSGYIEEYEGEKAELETSVDGDMSGDRLQNNH
jgi:cytochrome c oxidase subunit 4